MVIKVTFPTGSNSVSLTPLTQWDFGQQLEIESAELGGLIEVHFACHDMKEAIVRPCSVVNNVAVVSIPDVCLEQTSNITAWVYEVGDNSGKTVRTITIPIIARQKPIPCADVPVSIVDKYTEAVGAMNELVDTYKDTIPGAAQAEVAAIQNAGNAAVTNINTATQGALQNLETTKDDAIAEIESRLVLPVPTENTQKQLTEGPGYYYIRFEAPSNHECRYTFGVIYWSGTGFSYYTTTNVSSNEELHGCELMINMNGGLSIARYFPNAKWPIDDYWKFYTAKIG